MGKKSQTKNLGRTLIRDRFSGRQSKSDDSHVRRNLLYFNIDAHLEILVSRLHLTKDSRI